MASAYHSLAALRMRVVAGTHSYWAGAEAEPAIPVDTEAEKAGPQTIG
jgi:hypothetical protein